MARALRCFIATPEAVLPAQLDDSIRSVVSQEGDVDINYLINDPAQSADIRDIFDNWMSRIERGDVRIGCRSFSMTMLHHEGTSTGDVLNKVFADVPYGPDCFMTSLPCGDELAAGSLDAVTNVLSEFPDVELIRGIATTIVEKGVMTALDSDVLFDTWLTVGAASNVAFDQPALRGGLFWNSVVWRRLGGMDPALDYAFMLDFCSKAAALFRIASMEALLVVDRPPSVTSDDTGQRQAELTSVQQRAITRQNRMLHRLLQSGRDGAPISPSLRIIYHHRAKSWVAKDACQTLDLLGLAEVESGFLESEGPYPEAQLPNRFRWTIKRRASFTVVAMAPEQRIVMRIRNQTAKQAVALFLNEERIYQTELKSTSLADFKEINLNRTFKIGRNELTLVTDLMYVNDAGLSLGVIVEGVEIVPVH